MKQSVADIVHVCDRFFINLVELNAEMVLEMFMSRWMSLSYLLKSISDSSILNQIIVGLDRTINFRFQNLRNF